MGDEKKESQVKSMFDGNNRQVTRDCFYMTMVSLYQREPSDYIRTNTDVNDYEITAIYDPVEKFGNLPIFSEFVIHNKKDPTFEVSLKDYKKRYMEFRNLILDMVTRAKEQSKIFTENKTNIKEN